jgi:hypothetical protein
VGWWVTVMAMRRLLRLADQHACTCCAATFIGLDDVVDAHASRAAPVNFHPD